MKRDPYKHKEIYLAWKEKVSQSGISEINKYNSKIILQYLEDMEHGINISISSPKGGRSYIRLNTLRQKLKFFAVKFKEVYGIDKLTEIDEDQVVKFFSGMKKGIIKRNDGKTFKSSGYYAKNFKAFWHWWIKINKKKGIEVTDITLDVDTSGDKPRWVYLTEEEVKLLCENAKYKYNFLISFLFYSGIRSPT